MQSEIRSTSPLASTQCGPDIERGAQAALDAIEIGVEKTAGEMKAGDAIERDGAQHAIDNV